MPPSPVLRAGDKLSEFSPRSVTDLNQNMLAFDEEDSCSFDGLDLERSTSTYGITIVFEMSKYPIDPPSVEKRQG